MQVSFISHIAADVFGTSERVHVAPEIARVTVEIALPAPIAPRGLDFERAILAGYFRDNSSGTLMGGTANPVGPDAAML